MKIFATYCVALLAALTATSCRSSEMSGYFPSGLTRSAGEKVTKEYRVDNFTKVQISGPFDVTYEQRSGKPTVVVSSSDGIPEELDAWVEGKTLHIGFRGNKVSFFFLPDIKVKVTSEQLDEVKINGSGDFEQLGEMKTESMTVSIVGSGDVKMNNVNCTGLLKTQVTGSGDLAVQQATCARAEVSISGSGDVKLHRLKSATLKGSIKGSGDIDIDGEGQEAEYSISGSGDIDALDFVAKNIAVKVRGAGDVRCHATELLDLRSANMDNVSYKGNPRIIGKGRIE